MTLHLTAAQARALAKQDSPKKPRKTKERVPAKECGPNRCVACGYQTEGETDEVRHMTETGHHRFEMVLEDRK